MEDVRPLETVTDMGYISIGWNIDPEDFEAAARRRDRPQRSEGGQKNERHIVLLHDAGGDRSQTVKALPVLIDRLRGLGYELVTVSHLMGRSRDDVMPRLTADKKVRRRPNCQTFHLMYRLLGNSPQLFIVAAVLGIGRLMFIAAAAVIDKRQTRKRRTHPGTCRKWR